MEADPDALEWLIVQNSNAYEVGFSRGVGRPSTRCGRTRSEETEAPLRALLARETIKTIYLHGANRPELVSPDAWESDIALLQRPHAERLHLDLFYDYHTNVLRSTRGGRRSFASAGRRLSSSGGRETSSSRPPAAMPTSPTFRPPKCTGSTRDISRSRSTSTTSPRTSSFSTRSASPRPSGAARRRPAIAGLNCKMAFRKLAERHFAVPAIPQSAEPDQSRTRSARGASCADQLDAYL